MQHTCPGYLKDQHGDWDRDCDVEVQGVQRWPNLLTHFVLSSPNSRHSTIKSSDIPYVAWGGSHLIDNVSALEMRMSQQSPEMPAHRLRIPIDIDGTNLPVVHGVSCTDYERENIGPRLRSVLARYELAFQDLWEQARTATTQQKLGLNCKWSQEKLQFDYAFIQAQAMCCPCVDHDSNEDLTGPQRELLLWHWKLGVSMSPIQ